MTFWATLPSRRPSAAATRPSAAHAAAERRRPLHLRGGQADDDGVADLEVAVDDFGEAAVAVAGAVLQGPGCFAPVEEMGGGRLGRRRRAGGLPKRARRAGD